MARSYFYVTFLILFSSMNVSVGQGTSRGLLDCLDILPKLIPEFETPSETSQVNSVNLSYVHVSPTYRGLETVSGQRTNIGNYVAVVYQKKGKAAVTIRGRVVEEFPDGIRILNEVTGKTETCDNFWGTILSAEVAPIKAKWQELDITEEEELKYAVTETPDPYALLELSKPQKWIYGRITRFEAEPGYFVYGVRDLNNVLHVIDPTYTHFSASVLKGDENSKSLFHLKNSGTPVHLYDHKRNERGKVSLELVQSKSILDNPKYYEYLNADLASTKQMIKRWYHKDGEKLIKKVEKRLGEKYVSLLADPGIASRADKLIAFAENYLKENNDTSCIELRKAFSKKLGMHKIYRGMVLTDEQAKEMQGAGILSPAFRNAPRAAEMLSQVLDAQDRADFSGFATTPSDEIEGRIRGRAETNARMWMSVTDYEPIAASVGYYGSNEKEDKNKHLFVFEMNVPEISLIKQEGMFDARHKSDITVSVGEKFTVNAAKDVGVEMFIPYHLGAESIVSVKKYSEPPPRYIKTEH